MEKKSEKVLRYLLGHIEDAKYIVLSVEKMLLELKMNDTPQMRRQVVGMVKAFVDSEYIGCKFYDEEKICAVAMPSGRAWGKDSGEVKSAAKVSWRSALITFLCALLGGFSGALIVAFLPL